MSCEKCDKAQDEGMGYYLRVGNSHVKVIACVDHFREVQRLIKAGMAQDLIPAKEVIYFVKDGIAHIQDRIDLTTKGRERRSKCGEVGRMVSGSVEYTGEQIVADNRLLCQNCIEV